MCLHSERECCVRVRKSVESRQPRLREDARADGPHQCCSGQDKCKCRQHGFPFTATVTMSAAKWLTMMLSTMRCTAQRRRTERSVRRNSCAVVSFKTARRRVVQTSSRVMCDSCERSVSAVLGCLCRLWSVAVQARTVYSRWMLDAKPGQMRTDCSVYKKRIAERGNKPKRERERVGTSAVVQRVMVETSEYDDGMLIGSRFGFVSELTRRGTTPPLSRISGSSIEQRAYKKVHRKERGFNTLVDSSRLVSVMSVLSLERNGTSVAFTCSGDDDSSRQPRPLLQSSRVSLLTDQ